jgi:hypothetical protein
MIKAADLNKGDKFQWRGRTLEFIERAPRQGTRQAKNIFHCPDYVGLNGHGDKGMVEFSDLRLFELQRAS